MSFRDRFDRRRTVPGRPGVEYPRVVDAGMAATAPWRPIDVVEAGIGPGFEPWHPAGRPGHRSRRPMPLPEPTGATRMQIKVSSKHIDLTPAIESYAEGKVEKFSRYFDRIQEINVVIDRQRNEYTAEILVDVEHHEPFVARCSHEDLYASIDLTVDRATRQLSDHKSRLRDNKHHTPTSGA